MTNHTSMPRSINPLRSNVTEIANDDPSPNGTLYYSPGSEQENRKRGAGSKRQNRDEDDSGDHFPSTLSRKQSKLEDAGDKTMAIKPVSQSSTRKTRAITPQESIDNFQIVEPNWEENPLCWAYLQSLNPKFDNLYLKKKTTDDENRSGYCIGRLSDNDIVVDIVEVSRKHCLIYMETGAAGNSKGIRIYLEDKSFNGTFVNGHKVGHGNRRLLKGGDIIQLYRRENLQEDDPRHTFFRIRFPPAFDANRCEEVFNLYKELGKGNFATVFLAKHNKTNEQVAIKVMDKSRYEHKPKFLKSIINEMSIMMTLEKHPFVVKMKEIYNEDKTVYLVLEYVKDGELFNYIRERKKLTEDETRFIFWQLFSAIKFLHSANVAHRDLKPENVIMADKEKLHIKISDFGLAKTEGRDQAFDSQCGTPNYVAPEVLSPLGDRAYGKQCDLWSLGVMMFICLCGYPPFSDDTAPPSMKAQIKMARYEFASPYWDGISDEAKKLIKDLLTVDPMERATVDEALESEWMKMNPADMNKRKSALGEQALASVEFLSISESLEPTQRPNDSSLPY